MQNKNSSIDDKINTNDQQTSSSLLEKYCVREALNVPWKYGKRLWQEYGKQYVVDTSIGGLFYTALMIPVETIIFRGDFEKLYKSRIYALGVGFAVHWLHRVFRQWWARSIWHASPESSKAKKRAVDFTARLIFQVPLYLGGLLYAHATKQETYVAVPIGLVLGIATAPYYGRLLDRWRKYWGLEPTLYK